MLKNKTDDILQMHFLMDFLERQSMYFDSNLTKVCLQEHKWHKISTGTGNGMVLNIQHDIARNSDDLVDWHING